MEEFKVSEGEITARNKAIQKEMRVNNIDGLFISQRVDQFYFTGTAQNGYVYIPAEGEPLLFIKKYLPRAQEESPLKNIIGDQFY